MEAMDADLSPGHHVMGRLQETVTHVLKGVSDELRRFPKK